MDLLQRQAAPTCFCHFCPVGVTLSWEEAHPGARASRPHKSSRSFGHLLHRNQPAAAPCPCFGRAHAVPAGREVGCNIAGKLSGDRRDSMRAGRPRSRGCRPDGEVGGIRRATSLKAGLSPLGNSRLPASRAPPCRKDHSRVNNRSLWPIGSRDHVPLNRFAAKGTSIDRINRIRSCCRRVTSCPSWKTSVPFVVLRGPSGFLFWSFVVSRHFSRRELQS